MFDRARLSETPGSVAYAEAVPGASRLHEHATLVALLRLRPHRMSWVQLAEAVLEHGSAEAAWTALLGGQLFPDEAAEHARDQARTDLQSWHDDGMAFWAINDAEYPARVRDIHQSPPFLFSRGTRLDGDVAVSVVGSRAASERGLAMAQSVAKALSAQGVTVIAGLAAGIDTAAHETALQHGGRTVAVIGTGLGQTYPAANRALQERIARDGLVISQFWPEAPPRQQNFPMRNAVMSGYGHATVVIEAGETSGARIQARLAVEHGRPVILSDLVVTSTQWGRALLDRPNVYVARSTQDVTDMVGELVQRAESLTARLDAISV